MKDGIYKIAAATPHIRLGDVVSNEREIIGLIEKAADKKQACLCFPNSALRVTRLGIFFCSTAS